MMNTRYGAFNAHVKDSTFDYDRSAITPIAPWQASTATYYLNVPGVSGTVLLENIVFKGDPNIASWVRDFDPSGSAGGALGINQQCKGYLSGVAEGQICTPQVLLKNVDFSTIKDQGNLPPPPPLRQDQRPTWIKFGAESGNPFLGMVIAFDDSLCGKKISPCPFRAVLPKYSTHLLNLPGNPCNATMKPYLVQDDTETVGFLPLNDTGDWSRRFYNGIVCGVQTRRLTIWGKAQNTAVDPVDLIISPPGLTAAQGFRAQWMAFNRAYNKDQGPCPWAGLPCCMGTECTVDEPRRFAEGYGAAVIPSEYFNANQPWSIVRADGKPVDTSKITMVEFSDVVFDGTTFPGPDTIKMTMNGRECVLRSTDKRLFMGQYGPMARIQSGGSCIEEWLKHANEQLPPSKRPTTSRPSKRPTTSRPSKRPTTFPTRFPTKNNLKG